MKHSIFLSTAELNAALATYSVFDREVSELIGKEPEPADIGKILQALSIKNDPELEIKLTSEGIEISISSDSKKFIKFLGVLSNYAKPLVKIGKAIFDLGLALKATIEPLMHDLTKELKYLGSDYAFNIVVNEGMAISTLYAHYPIGIDPLDNSNEDFKKITAEANLKAVEMAGDNNEFTRVKVFVYPDKIVTEFDR